MAKLQKLKKKSVYLLAFAFSLVASYVFKDVAEDEPIISEVVPTAFADTVSGGGGSDGGSCSCDDAW